MAKRTRGSSSRPGQRRPLQRTVGRTPSGFDAGAAPAAPVVRPSGLTDAEEARAAELEAQIVAEERAADASRRRSPERRKGGAEPIEPVRRSALGLAVRAADEYAYVGRDVRRIALLGGSLITLLIVLWIATHVAGAGPA